LRAEPDVSSAASHLISEHAGQNPRGTPTTACRLCLRSRVKPLTSSLCERADLHEDVGCMPHGAPGPTQPLSLPCRSPPSTFHSESSPLSCSTPCHMLCPLCRFVDFVQLHSSSQAHQVVRVINRNADPALRRAVGISKHRYSRNSGTRIANSLRMFDASCSVTRGLSTRGGGR
jgi:hypothetical protein